MDNVSVDIAATPLPVTLPLFVSGLGLISLLERRKRRKKAAANAFPSAEDHLPEFLHFAEFDVILGVCEGDL